MMSRGTQCRPTHPQQIVNMPLLLTTILLLKSYTQHAPLSYLPYKLRARPSQAKIWLCSIPQFSWPLPPQEGFTFWENKIADLLHTRNTGGSEAAVERHAHRRRAHHGKTKLARSYLISSWIWLKSKVCINFKILDYYWTIVQYIKKNSHFT